MEPKWAKKGPLRGYPLYPGCYTPYPIMAPYPNGGYMGWSKGDGWSSAGVGGRGRIGQNGPKGQNPGFGQIGQNGPFENARKDGLKRGQKGPKKGYPF